MDLQQERPPAYSHEPENLQLPSVPSGDLLVTSQIHLPDLKSLGLPESTAARNYAAHPAFQPNKVNIPPLPSGEGSQWHHVQPLQSSSFPRVPTNELRGGAEIDIGSPMSSVMSIEDGHLQKTASIASIDDPDVRLAVEGLSALGNPDFIRSPSARSATLPPNSHSSATNGYNNHPKEPEPLLSLLTSSHPWIGGTINGSLSAYSSTKHYSPRFIQYGAEFVERNLGSPVVNTVSSVGRRTGVEGSLRRYLGRHRRSSDHDNYAEGLDNANSNKRRRMTATLDFDAMDVEKGLQSPPMGARTRCDSQSSYTESLPAYDDQRSPRYEEHDTMAMEDSTQRSDANQRANWPTQLMITTSGLGVALSESSLNSLKACLRLLRSATQHVDSVMGALKLLLEDYEKAIQPRQNRG